MQIDYSDADALRSAWVQFKEDNPEVRARDTAGALGVSEAELLAADCGVDATRLRPDWYDLLPELEGLAEVMALTRNDVFVHEKVGHYSGVRLHRDHAMASVLGEHIDLRLFLRHWHFGFAVEEASEEGMKRSLQFFDRSGTAVHKTHLRAGSDVGHFASIVETYRAANQSVELSVGPVAEPEPVADEEVDVDLLRRSWRGLQDTHDFAVLLRRLGVTRLQAFRLGGREFAYEVGTHGLRTVLEAAASEDLPLMIFVGNRGCLQIHTGPVRRLKDVRGWYNVLDPGFNLHVREDEIEAAWVVRKPTTDGDVHSLEFFDAAGNVVCYLFGHRKEGAAESARWRDLLDEL